MTNVKISELSAAASLTGSEEVPVVQSGSTVRTTTGDIAGLVGGGAWTAATVAITLDNTTSKIVTLNTSVRAMQVVVTTDGSGLAQVLVLPNFTLDTNSEAISFVGYRVTVVCPVLANALDTPLVTVVDDSGTNAIYAWNSAGTPNLATYSNATGSGPADAIPINFAGAYVSLIWGGFAWAVDDTTFNTAAQFNPLVGYLPDPDSNWLITPKTNSGHDVQIRGASTSTGNGGMGYLQGGQSADNGFAGGVGVVSGGPGASGATGGNGLLAGGNSLGGGKGGDAYVQGGAGSSGSAGGTVILLGGTSADAAAGDIQITPGTGAAGARGKVIIDIAGLPTTDPTTAGQLWYDSGTKILHISTG